MTTPEKYLPPKELTDAIFVTYGIRISASYIRAIRRETTRRGDPVFACGMGRPSEVVEWLKRNPQFRRRSSGTPGCVAA